MQARLDAVTTHRRDTNDRDQGHFHPSTIGHCARQIVLERLKVPKKPFDVRVQRIFENGHYVHERIQKECAEAGIMVKDEMPIGMTDHNCSGHTDGFGWVYLAELGGISFIIEIKSAGEKSFKRMRDGDRWNPKGPPKSYLWQVQLYMYMTGLYYTVFIIENKNDQDRLYVTIKRDNELIQGVLLPKIDLVNGHVDAGTLPPRDAEHPDMSCFECRYCDYGPSGTNVCGKEESLRAQGAEAIDLIAIGNELLATRAS